MQLQSEFIKAEIDFWQQVLNLQHWRIDWTTTDTLSDVKHLVEIVPTRCRQHARIFVRRSVLEKTNLDELRILIVHELVHLLLEPIAEEHNFELQYSVDKLRQDECKARFTQALEKTVEHTAQMLCKAIKNEV